MARIRSVKPEFWEDETVGLLTVHARLLFVATWNLADDEGLLRWSPAYLKASVFMYDASIDLTQTKSFMDELVKHDLVYCYKGGRAKQDLAFIVNFRKHQNINRPGPGKLPPPSVNSTAVARMYGRRDNWTCHLCGLEILQETQVSLDPYDPAQFSTTDAGLSLDHIVPQSLGGSDYPSNIAAAHISCNKARGNRPLDTLKREPTEGVKRALSRAAESSVNDSVNVPRDVAVPSLAEGKGAGKGREGSSAYGRAPSGAAPEPSAQITIDRDPDPDVTAQTLLAEHLDACKARPPKRVVGQIAREVKRLLDERIDPGHIRAGLELLRTRAKHPATLPALVNEVLNPPEPRPRSPNGTPATAADRHAATRAQTSADLDAWAAQAEAQAEARGGDRPP